MRIAIVAFAAALLLPAAGPAAAGKAQELHAPKATEFSAAKKKKAAKTTAMKPRAKKKEQYMRAVPAK
ncbi:MAG: hypothetical protein FJX62_10695 [Alphaproteobacteria bacterium]|nr:hypothetical protein [Alphaproteobacteria bacterium]